MIKFLKKLSVKRFEKSVSKIIKNNNNNNNVLWQKEKEQIFKWLINVICKIYYKLQKMFK